MTTAILISKEDALRQFLKEKPRNAKVMSQLSSLLVDRSKTISTSTSTSTRITTTNNINNDDDDDVDCTCPTTTIEAATAAAATAATAATAKVLREEAIQLAKHAIQIAPHRPFGYAALSVAAFEWKERKQALCQAITLSTDSFRIARIALLIRLLIDEREEEAKLVKDQIGKASLKHPHRRQFTTAETQLYHRIVKDMKLAHIECDKMNSVTTTGPTESMIPVEFLYQQEYRLGLFFRKKMPPEIQLPRAKYHLEQALASSMHKEMANFWLATLPNVSTTTTTTTGSTPSIDKCPASYVVGLYSTFAGRFDTLLVQKLHYQTPTKLRQLLNTAIMDTGNPSLSFQRACDLGCGTGLSGIAFQDCIQGTMIGVDLSPQMLQQAQTRGCYSELHLGDIESTLMELVITKQSKSQSQPPHDDSDSDNDSKLIPLGFDLILACDVFCYIGDLANIFKIVTQSLMIGGYFVFSTELLEMNSSDTPFRLHSCARFSHRQDYIQELASTNNLQIVRLQVATLRKNQGEDVKGVLVVLQKL